MKEYIKIRLRESADLKYHLADRFSEIINDVADLCVGSIRDGGKIMFCGNGGSAADSQHLAAELVVRLSGDNDRQALPGLALTTDTSILTACSNDYGLDHVFSRQVEAIGRKGDVLVAISTSGNSPNILKAVETAKKMGILTIGVSGKSGGKLISLTDKLITVPSDDVQHIQEAHITIGHIIIGLIEQELT